MNAAARWGAGAAQVHARKRRAVRGGAGFRARQQLPERIGPAAHVAAHEVGVPALQGRGGTDLLCQHQLRKAWGKAFDLAFQRGKGVAFKSVGHMNVRPEGVLTRWGAAGVEQALLGQQHIGALGHPAPVRREFGGLQLTQGAAQMYGSGQRGAGVAPGQRAGQRVIDLEGPHAGFELPQPGRVALRQRIARQPQKPRQRGIKNDGLILRQFLQVRHRRIQDDLAAQLRQQPRQRARKGLRPAAWKGPAHRVPAHRQHQPEGRGAKVSQWQPGVRRQPAQQCPCLWRAEHGTGQQRGRGQATHTEAGQRDRVRRNMHQRAQGVVQQALPVGDQRAEQGQIRALVNSQPGGGFFQAAVHQHTALF